MLPSVAITKAAFATGVTSPSTIGLLALIAAAFTGTQNQAGSYARDDLMLSSFGYGPLTEYGSYCIQNGQNNVVAVRPTTSIAAAYGSIASTPGTGTSACTSSGAMAPLDDYNLLVTIVAGGTVGASGITYTYSLDGGNTTSGVQQLPAATPATVNFNVKDGTTVAQLLFGAGTLVPGAAYQCYTSRALANASDLTAALEALRVTRQPWEGVFVDCQYVGGTTVPLLDTWLSGLEAVGQFHYAIVNTRKKLQPAPTAESEATYAAAMQTLTQNTHRSGSASARTRPTSSRR